MIFSSRLLSLFSNSVSAVYSFLKHLRYTTNRQANKFEELQLRFRFWSPRRDLFSDSLRNRNLCLGRDPCCGNHWLQRLNQSKRFKPVLICRCVSLHRILQGVKCAAQTITAVPAAGMTRKRSYHLQQRCWNEHRWLVIGPGQDIWPGPGPGIRICPGRGRTGAGASSACTF